ncbi:MAG: ATP-binding cassette domain-containing protein [Clostridia bacterium]|nr:ATP-binding cassette domain-containing protein [Clostridia bacterium]
MINVKNLNKKYNQKTALCDFSFEIEQGRVLGLLGPNGSGKSTLMNILAGSLKQDDGNIYIDKRQIGEYTKSIVSYFPENNNLYRWMKVKDIEKFYDNLFYDFDKEKFILMKEKFGLKDNESIIDLSKGVLQKLRLGLVLSRRARVFLLDEPLGGIDTLSREQVMNTIFDCISEDVTIILATHLIDEVERLFDKVLFIKNGKVMLFEDCDTLRSENGSSIKSIYLEVMKND